MSDLTFLDNGNANFHPDGLINFSKCRLIYNQIRDLVLRQVGHTLCTGLYVGSGYQLGHVCNRAFSLAKRKQIAYILLQEMPGPMSYCISMLSMV